MSTNQFIGLLCANLGVIALAFSSYCQNKVNQIVLRRLNRLERHMGWLKEDKP